MRFLKKIIYNILYTFSFLRTELSVFADQRIFLTAQFYRGTGFTCRRFLTASDEVVDCGVEEVGKSDKRFNIGFNIVVFVLVDGLLTYPNLFSQCFLRNPGSLSQETEPS